MTEEKDLRWHVVLGAMRNASKTVPDDPGIITASMHALADLIVEVSAVLSDEQAAVLVGVGGILWHHAMREASAKVQTMVVLGQIKPIKEGPQR